MSVSISYSCTRGLDAPRRVQLLARVDQDVAGFKWWAESICLWETDTGVDGNSSLFLLSAEPDEDSIMAWANATHIVKLLHGYARDFGIQWDVSMEELPMGQVTGNASDEAVFRKLEMLLSMGDVEPGDPGLPARIKEIDAKYADRWD